ncbi:MAG: DNA topoisomerase, partial [Clostridia bacterium]|nr:DNA topoisomerase [Clostridia bacterium]
VNKRSREQAEKARVNIKKKLSGGNDLASKVQKLAECRTKDIEKRELYIVEGDSALGSVVLARNAEFQAAIPVRGKILNCLKADYDKIFKSEIITDLLKVLGCGVEIKSKNNKDFEFFDMSKLRYGKIIICTDADVDGFQIRTLILTMLYRLVPSLITQGKVYIAESPLFEIVYKDKNYFAYNEAERIEIEKKLEGKKYQINRSKGLGENEPDMMSLTTMHPDTRRLIKVLPEDVERTNEIFELLLGDNIDGRKEYIADHGHEYLELADVF